jgi:heterodisulfide reductase subunit B2
MEYGYYPGCSLTGSAHKLDRAVRRIFEKSGHVLKDIPDWNCCGAAEYGDRRELNELSRENLMKAKGLCKEIIAPCPACYKNLKDANSGESVSVLHPLEVFDESFISALSPKQDLQGRVFTPYYGCMLLRPTETAIKNTTVMEDFITRFKGDVEGGKVRDRCCGGNQFFANKWATEKLSRLVVEQSKGTIVVFCPLCHMAIKTFCGDRKVVYFTDLVLYVMGETNRL